uniref:Uncharacterized protein n=1 Tax=Cyanoderma ruficeps TaxID=181631 RepID=A0A8C3RDA9_9PASS
MQACSSLWPKRPAPGLLSSKKVPQGSVSPTPLDVSDFLLTCNKLSNRFKSTPFLTHAFPAYAKHLWLKQLLEETQGRKLKHCESKLQKERLLFTKISSCHLKKTCRTRTIHDHSL